ncbi:MAG: alpha/beta hydrolase [Blautia sp.]|nr:alpha/beta hydrolase [Blautia sp.]
MGENTKLAVFFPGIGYHVDKPLLYYTKKLAVAAGFDTVDVPYKNTQKNVKGNNQKMMEAYREALQQAEILLQDIRFEQYKKLLFVSKSMGTAVACSYQRAHGLRSGNIYFTPVVQTFSVVVEEGIVFHGSADPWARCEMIEELCREKKIPIYITENGNHSLETGDVETDLANLQTIMEKVKLYMKMIGE